MEVFEAIIIGIIQGIFEWLPVSSEGMTSLAMINFFGKPFGQALVIAIWLHLGTTLAAIVYFRKEVKEIVNQKLNILREPGSYSIRAEKYKLFNFILFSTLISLCVGGIIYFTALKNLNIAGNIATIIIGIMLLITGLILLKAKSKNKSKETNLSDSVLIGALQGLSIIPGISRSGITVSALLMKGYEPKKALALSFLMSIPAVLIAVIAMIVFEGFAFGVSSLIAITIAFVFGLLTIKLLMKLAQKINFGWFCIIFGVLSILSGIIFF